MKPLLKIISLLVLCFASTFIVVKISGILTIEDIEHWLARAQNISSIYVAGAIVILLFLDLFIAVPTLTITLLAGHFLGHQLGAATALSGMALAAVAGYGISYRFGPRVLTKILRNQGKINETNIAFKQHGFIMILLARAVPILPEVTACLAGVTRMSFPLFVSAWLIGTVPYVLIATYAGSISTLDNPKPAIFTAIAITGTLWVCWLIFTKSVKGKTA